MAEGRGGSDFPCEAVLHECDAKIFVQQKCLTFRRISAKFVIDDNLDLQLVQKEAQSLPFQTSKWQNIYFQFAPT